MMILLYGFVGIFASGAVVGVLIFTMDTAFPDLDPWWRHFIILVLPATLIALWARHSLLNKS